ncbi:head decoration protein [Vallitalea maricola]|uniref:Uncharacterized protein n=1 Tax=Vallitalea maricola TaxID=3074433 RepID=A0ACB5UR36_9FIRM|nr:hypothetical protein AN2V17_35850 [Vallitalea sp. AN17-2]
MINLHNTIGEFVPDKLIADTQIPIRLEGIVLEKGKGILRRGTFLGRKESDGLYKIVNKASSDGSQKPICVLTDDVDTGDDSAVKDVRTTAYFSGVFNQNALIIEGDGKPVDFKDELRDRSIYLENAK